MSENNPVLDEARTRLDWSNATYKGGVIIKGEVVSVVHQIQGGKALRKAIESKEAKAGVELRCPRVLTSKLEEIPIPPKGLQNDDYVQLSQEVEFKTSEIIGSAYIIPGINAVKDFAMSGEELNDFAWGDSVNIGKGWRLGRGEVYNYKSFLGTIMRFWINKELPEGQMLVEQRETETDSPYFLVNITEEMNRNINTDRSLQVASVIAVCAQFPYAEFLKLDIDSPTTTAIRLKNFLEEKASGAEGMRNVLWDNDDYDPAYTATLFEPFEFPPNADVLGDDD